VTYRFLAAEETLVTPYKFGVYDLLVLPPSFPYGGMVGILTLASIAGISLLSVLGKRLYLIPHAK
jgi:hypothetical protein